MYKILYVFVVPGVTKLAVSEHVVDLAASVGGGVTYRNQSESRRRGEISNTVKIEKKGTRESTELRLASQQEEEIRDWFHCLTADDKILLFLR